MKIFFKITVFFTFLSLIACREDKKDIITKHPITGMVYNNCTDSGLAGVKVFLQTFKDDKTLVQQRETVSGDGGKIEFSDVEIHSSEQYNYALHIESKDGTTSQTPEHCGFDGTTMYFFRHEVDMEFKPRVTPRFLRCCIQMSPLQKITHPDSVSVVFEQRVFHKNVPDLPYTAWYGPYFTGTAASCSWGNYPMGLWQIKIEKWKNGIYSLKHDSIYLDWKDIKTYTVEW